MLLQWNFLLVFQVFVLKGKKSPYYVLVQLGLNRAQIKNTGKRVPGADEPNFKIIGLGEGKNRCNEVFFVC